MIQKGVILIEKIYKTIGDIKLSLKIYRPADWQESNSRAAVIFFFGGGWVGGTIDHFKLQSEYLAEHGMIAITADYRVESRHGTSPLECVKDGKTAVAWVKNHCDELGIDPERIAVGGSSAGGHVAASTVLIPDKKILNNTIQESVSSIPSAMVLCNPVLDTSENGYGAEKLRKIKPSEKFEDWTEQLSPFHHLHGNIPPTIIFHGTDDNTVPFKNAQDFTDKMKKMGNQCTLFQYEGQEHGFINIERDKDIFYDTLKKMEEFFISLGYISKKN